MVPRPRNATTTQMHSDAVVNLKVSLLRRVSVSGPAAALAACVASTGGGLQFFAEPRASSPCGGRRVGKGTRGVRQPPGVA